MKADILYEALAALQMVMAADRDIHTRIPAPVYSKVIQAAVVLEAALKAQGLTVEVTA